jgi:hypothetical protein
LPFEEPPMPREISIYSPDPGQEWKAVIAAWKTSLIVWNSIGVSVTTYHWEHVSVVVPPWGRAERDTWVRRPVESIILTCSFVMSMGRTPHLWQPPEQVTEFGRDYVENMKWWTVFQPFAWHEVRGVARVAAGGMVFSGEVSTY